MSLTVFTVVEAFLEILAAHGIESIADVRTIPRSRHNPQFGSEALAASLQRAGLEYSHLPLLGGLRRPRPDSRNLAWRNGSFRGYADHMETAEFEAGIASLLPLAGDRHTAILCAEAVYFRCHRALISDALVCRGIEVVHLFDARRREPHRPTQFMKVRDGCPFYPAEQGELPGGGAGEVVGEDAGAAPAGNNKMMR